MLQIELQDNQVIKVSTKDETKGSIKFTSEMFEINPQNPNATNLVSRQCYLFGDIKALQMRLISLGMLSSTGEVIQSGLDNFVIVKTKSYVPFNKNSEPAYCPYPDHKDYESGLMTDDLGSNYYLQYSLAPKYTIVDKVKVLTETYVDLTDEQDTIELKIQDFPRLLDLYNSRATVSEDQGV